MTLDSSSMSQHISTYDESPSLWFCFSAQNGLRHQRSSPPVSSSLWEGKSPLVAQLSMCCGHSVLTAPSAKTELISHLSLRLSDAEGDALSPSSCSHGASSRAAPGSQVSRLPGRPGPTSKQRHTPTEGENLHRGLFSDSATSRIWDLGAVVFLQAPISSSAWRLINNTCSIG